MRISVIVPTLDEAAHIGDLLSDLQPIRQIGEVLVVDGGSRDETVALAEPLADAVITCAPPGRARQMNAGAVRATGEWLWFLHADCRIPPAGLSALQSVLDDPLAGWGRFDVRLSASTPLLRLVAHTMNLRSRFTGMATGDQGMFVRRHLFAEVGGFPEQPLMEDLELSRRLLHCERPRCLHEPLVTSSRRWEQRGVLATIFLMWRLRFAWWRGVDPSLLAARYRGGAS